MAGYKRTTDFFEVTISPNPKKSRNSEPPPVLTLAPFALIPKVCFSNIKVSTEARSSVLLHNPSDVHVEVQLEVTKDLLTIGLQFNALFFTIRPGSKETLEIRWLPKSVVASRGKVNIRHVNGEKKFSYITIACSSIQSPTKKRTQKKVSSSRTTPAKPRRSTTKTMSFADSHPPVTPSRRETYEVLKPTYKVPIITHTSPKGPSSASLSILEEDFESHFTCSKFVSSSPHSKQTDPTKRPREPLKEFNYNVQPVIKIEQSPILIKKDEYPISRIKIERLVTDSIFEISDADFDRDSLESGTPICSVPPTSVNLSFSFSIQSNIHCDSSPQKSLSETPPKSEPRSPIQDRSFYLVSNRTQNATFTNNESSEIPACYKENQSSMKLEFTPPRQPPNVTPPRQLDTNASLLPNESITDNFYSLLKSDTTYFDATFPIVNLSESNIAEQTQYISITNVQQPLTFDISPSRPVFVRNTNTVGNLKFRKEIIVKEEPVDIKPDITEADCFQVFHPDKTRFCLYSEPDYLLHPYGVTAIADPFSKHAIHPRAWLEKLELELIKWLNSLLAPPIKLGSILEGVDVKKLWDQSTASSLKIAPSREAASNDYVLSDGSRMTALRKAAVSLAKADEFQRTIYNIRGKIDTGFLCVKDDINLFHNQGARVKLVQLCMYYNPLWLRIALEVMYEQYIPVHQNNIHRGLVYFLKSYFLSDQSIVSKYKSTKATHPHGPAFILEMNNFIILKFLTLVYFLDQAKMKKLIPYDPCLFCKNSPIKESEGMLNEFIKEYLKCVGQFKKTLKGIGYKLEYRQTFLQEFDYGLTSHLDLRDGVRLTRTMETILKDSSYSMKLWTPVTSRVQKIHNVQIAFSAIQNNGLVINGIVPTDVVSGHREKIFSLLWQILHDFLAPMYKTNAKKIQIWWRKHYLKVMINKRIAMKKQLVKVQAHARGFLVRQRIKKMHSAATLIQRQFKKNVMVLKERGLFLRKRHAAIKIQSWFRSILKMREDRKNFLLIKQSAIKIEIYYRNYAQMKFCRDEYRRKKHAALRIQRWYRNLSIFRHDRKKFLMLRNNTTKIQLWFRSVLLVHKDRKSFLQKQNAILTIQKWYRNCVGCRAARKEFTRALSAVCVIQKAFRNYHSAKTAKRRYILQRESAIVIQRYLREYLVMKTCRKIFLEKKNAAITIQRWYRNIVQFRMDRKRYLLIKNATVVIQRHFKARFGTIKERKKFLLLRRSSIKIQRWYREILLLRKKIYMERFRNAAVLIQARYRGHLARKNLKPQIEKLAKKKQMLQKKSKSGFDLSAVFTNAISYNKCKNKHTRKLGDLVITYRDIDVCTRFSPVLCRALKECNDFFKLLWNDLNQCFRDGPYLDIFRNGLNIIIKLVKFQETVDFIILTMDIFDGYSILVHLMGKYIEKNTEIFCKAATIIWLLLSCPSRKEKVKEKIDISRLNFFHKMIMAKRANEAKKKFIPPLKLDWGYFDKPTEFLSVKTASEEIRKLLIS